MTNETKPAPKSAADRCIEADRRDPQPHFQIVRHEPTGLAVYAPRARPDEVSP